MDAWHCILIFLILALIYWTVRLRRQVRCLHYCLVGISDWGIEKLDEVKNAYVVDQGEENLLSVLRDANQEWQTKITQFSRQMRKTGVSVSVYNHVDYPHER
jgi:hypothetical protein